MTVELRDESFAGPAAQELLRAFTGDVVERYPEWTPDVGPTATPEEFVPPTGLFLVAYDDDFAVGCAGFKRFDRETAEVKRMYVTPPWRRRGLAQQILSRLEARARQAGYVVIRLDTGDRQPEALALFRGSGYREIGDYNGNPFARYWFEKRLS